MMRSSPSTRSLRELLAEEQRKAVLASNETQSFTEIVPFGENASFESSLEILRTKRGPAYLCLINMCNNPNHQPTSYHKRELQSFLLDNGTVNPVVKAWINERKKKDEDDHIKKEENIRIALLSRTRSESLGLGSTAMVFNRTRSITRLHNSMTSISSDNPTTLSSSINSLNTQSSTELANSPLARLSLNNSNDAVNKGATSPVSIRKAEAEPDDVNGTPKRQRSTSNLGLVKE